MKPFLRQVVDHYFTTSDTTLFVFPNHRSEIFFQSYFEEKMLEEESLKVMMMPRHTSIADLFATLDNNSKLADQITLLTELYEVYASVKTAHGQAPESIDDFIFWGGVILSDFGDIDRYMVDAEQLLVNVSEYKNIAVDYTEFAKNEQIAAIMSLLGHIGIGQGEENIKEFHKKFIAIWDLLYEIYDEYKDRLMQQGLAYDGMLQRQVVDSLKNIDLKEVFATNFGSEVQKVVFVGLNALSTAEKELLKALRDRGLAEFCWDYPSDSQKIMLSDPANKSSFFINEYLKVDSKYYFPQAFPVEFGAGTEFKIVSTNSDILACKLIPEFLKGPVTLDKKTLIMLPDEGLLPSVLTSFPQVEGMTVNVTMGASLALTQSFVFLKNLLSLFDGTKPKYFYHKLVWDLFASSIFANVHTEFAANIAAVKNAAKVYIPLEDLTFSPVFSKLPLNEQGEVSCNDIQTVTTYLKDILLFVGQSLDVSQTLERQSIFEMYKNINILLDKKLHETYPDLKFETYKALIINLISGLKVPYKGEPLSGVQVMGPLEVRALDFENIMILSATENSFPRKNVADSFIPYTLRKAFKMPTYEHQDAIWAYYFYRLVSRAKNVWMVYNNVANGLRTGEPSRYIMQLKYGYCEKYGLSMSYAASLPSAKVVTGYKEYENSKPYAGIFSATLYKTYLRCPLQFYYQYILGIKEPDEVSEDVENNDIGNILHRSMEHLYTPFVGRDVTKADIVQLRSEAPAVVKEYVQKLLKVKDIEGKYLLAYNTALSYVKAVLDEDEIYAGETSFRIVGLEQEIHAEFQKSVLMGYIDRIDAKDGTVRILDYKTGKVSAEEINPVLEYNKNGSIKNDTIAKLFDPDSSDRPDIALQLFVYDYLWKHLLDDTTTVYIDEQPVGKGNLLEYKDYNLVNTVYCPYALAKQRKDGEKNTGYFTPDRYDACQQRLKELHSQILKPQVTLARRDNCTACKWCDFEILCKK